MRNRFAEFQEWGIGILVVTLSKPAVLKMYEASKEFPFTLIADPERTLYRQFGLERVSIWRMLNPLTMLFYFSLILRGWLVRPVKKGEDVMQLGGDFLIDSEFKLVYVHRSVDPSDRPSANKLLKIIAQKFPVKPVPI